MNFFQQKIKEDFRKFGYAFVNSNRDNRIFFEHRKDGARVATYDTKTADFSEAYFIIGNWITNGFPMKKGKSDLFSDFCYRYWLENLEGRDISKMTMQKQADVIKIQVEPYFKDLTIQQVTPAIVRKFLQELKNKEVGQYKNFKTKGKAEEYNGNKYISIGYIDKIRTVITRPLCYASKVGLNNKCEDWSIVCRLELSKMKNKENVYLKKMVKPRDIFLKSEIQKLDNAEWSDARARICYLILRYMGLRYGEVRALKVGKVLSDRLIIDNGYNDFDGLKRTKTGDCREIPLAKWLYLEIQNYITSYLAGFNEKNNWLLPSSADINKPISKDFFPFWFDVMLNKLGIPKKREVRGVVSVRCVYSLRHTRELELLEAGLSIRHISLLQGHSPRMVEHYTSHYSNDDFENITEKLKAGGLLDKPKESVDIILPLPAPANVASV